MSQVRRHFITEPRYQMRFAFAFVRGALLAIALPALLAFVAAILIARQPGLNESQRTILNLAVRHSAVLFIVASAVVGAGAFLIGLRLSHRYAGPLKRIEAWVARDLLGQPTSDLVLRPGDELTPMNDALMRIRRMRKS